MIVVSPSGTGKTYLHYHQPSKKDGVVFVNIEGIKEILFHPFLWAYFRKFLKDVAPSSNIILLLHEEEQLKELLNGIENVYVVIPDDERIQEIKKYIDTRIYSPLFTNEVDYMSILKKLAQDHKSVILHKGKNLVDVVNDLLNNSL